MEDEQLQEQLPDKAKEAALEEQEIATVAPRRHTGLIVLTVVLTIAAIVGACAVTAGLVNQSWERRMARLEENTTQELTALRQQLQAQAKMRPEPSGNSVSGTAVASPEGMTPSQVYAKNAASVVAIVSGSGGVPGSIGSGFILTEDGYVVSNYHVVESSSTVTVITNDNTEYKATMVGFDSNNDVAVLKIEAEGLQAVTIGSSDNLIVGDQVVAIGNPLGKLTSTLTVGYVSAKDRAVATDGSLINMMQTDAAINSGNSGGPLFNMLGQVVGITTAKYSGATASGASVEGIGFAIPIDDVIGMLGDLKDYGYVTGAHLGVSVQNMDDMISSMYGLPQGSYVVSVEDGSCAQTAGIEPKDIITGLGEYTITGNLDLTRTLRKFSPGDATTITVYRSGKSLNLSITLDSKPVPAEPQPEDSDLPQNGSYEEWYNYFAPFFRDNAE